MQIDSLGMTKSSRCQNIGLNSIEQDLRILKQLQTTLPFLQSSNEWE